MLMDDHNRLAPGAIESDGRNKLFLSAFDVHVPTTRSEYQLDRVSPMRAQVFELTLRRFCRQVGYPIA
jgi:hypothetical protein